MAGEGKLIKAAAVVAAAGAANVRWWCVQRRKLTKGNSEQSGWVSFHTEWPEKSSLIGNI